MILTRWPTSAILVHFLQPLRRDSFQRYQSSDGKSLCAFFSSNQAPFLAPHRASQFKRCLCFSHIASISRSVFIIWPSSAFHSTISPSGGNIVPTCCPPT